MNDDPRLRTRLAGGFAAALLLAPGMAAAQDLDALQARLEALESQLNAQAAKIDAQAAEIRELKAARAGAEVVEGAAAERVAPATPIHLGGDVRARTEPPGAVTLPGGRLEFTSADGRFQASLRAILHIDAAHYIQDSPGPPELDFRRAASPSDTGHARDLASGAAVRRARLALDGKAFGDVDYNFMVEFAGPRTRLIQGWAQYNGLAPLRLRAGVMSPSDDFDGTWTKNFFPLMEPAATTEVLRGLASGPGRIGAQAFGYGERWFAAVALTGGSTMQTDATFDDQTAVLGRVAGRPLLWSDGWLHIGAEYAYLLSPADMGGPDATGPRRTVAIDAHMESRVDRTVLIGTGDIPADHAFTESVELAFQHRSLLLQGEYVRVGVERPAGPLSDPRFSSWYVAGAWMLTGERRGYNVANATLGVTPVARSFDPSTGGWGAFELAARYSVVDLDWRAGREGEPVLVDGVRGGEQRTVSAGVNWYLNPALRLMLGVQDVRISRLSPDPVVYETPVGAQVGQHFQVVSVRSQLAF